MQYKCVSPVGLDELLEMVSFECTDSSFDLAKKGMLDEDFRNSKIAREAMLSPIRYGTIWYVASLPDAIPLLREYCNRGYCSRYFQTSRNFQLRGNPISWRFRRLPPSPIIERMFRFKSLSGLIILLIYLMQQSTVKILLGWRVRSDCLSRNGLSTFVGKIMFMIHRLFQIRLWCAQQLRHTAIAWSQLANTLSSLSPNDLAIPF